MGNYTQAPPLKPFVLDIPSVIPTQVGIDIVPCRDPVYWRRDDTCVNHLGYSDRMEDYSDSSAADDDSDRDVGGDAPVGMENAISNSGVIAHSRRNSSVCNRRGGGSSHNSGRSSSGTGHGGSCSGRARNAQSSRAGRNTSGGRGGTVSGGGVEHNLALSWDPELLALLETPIGEISMDMEEAEL